MAQTIGKKSEGKMRFRVVWAESGSILAGGGAKLYVFLCFSWFTLIFLGIALGFFRYFLVFPLQLLVIFRKHPFIFQGFSCFFLVFSLCFGKLGRGGSKLYAFLWFSWFTLVSLVFALHFLGVPGGFTEN